MVNSRRVLMVVPRHAWDRRPNSHPVVPSHGLRHNHLAINDVECVRCMVDLIGVVESRGGTVDVQAIGTVVLNYD